MNYRLIALLASAIFLQPLFCASNEFKRAVVLIDRNPQKDSSELTEFKGLLDRNVTLIADQQDEQKPPAKDQIDTRDFTLLHYAAAQNSVETCKIIRRKGQALPDFLDTTAGESKLTPLMVAAQQQSIEVVDLLLEYGASIGIQSSDKKTALHYAAQVGNRDLVVLLLKKGGLGLRYWVDADGKRPADLTTNADIKDLFASITIDRFQKLLQAQRRKLIKDLLSIRPKVASETNVTEKSTCLHAVMLNPDLEILKAVLACKPDIDAQNKANKTALFVGVEEYFKATSKDSDVQELLFQAIAVLLKNGARVDVGDSFKKTPLSFAQEKLRVARGNALEQAQKMVDLLKGDIPTAQEDIQKEFKRVGDALKSIQKQVKELQGNLKNLSTVVGA